MDTLLPLNPFLGMGLELGALLGMMGGLRLYQRLRSLSPESSRKLFHIGGGLTTLTFPYVFSNVWPVLILTMITIPTLLALKYVKGLKGGLGNVLYNVDRSSFGEVYFPLSVCILFLLSHNDPLLYSIPIIILTLADTVAALIGVRYGQYRYAATEGQKSAEGSLAFFVVAFLSVLTPLLIFSNTGRVETLLIAAILGFLVMMSEAVAWRGLDNLFIPMASYALLRTLLRVDLPGLIVEFIVIAVLSGFAFLWRKRTTLNGGALMGAILGAYLIWTLGDWKWLLVPFILFASYTTLLPKTDLDSKRLINIQAIFSVACVGLLWLFLARLAADPTFFYPFTIAFAAHLPMIGIVRQRYVEPETPLRRVLLPNIAKGWAMLLLAYLIFDGLTLAFCIHAAVGLLGVAIATLIFTFTQPALAAYPTDWGRWRREALCAGAGSMVGLAPAFAVMLSLAPLH